MDSLTVIEPVTCLACGCLCDDLAVSRRGESVVQIEHGCDVSRAWFERDRSGEADLPIAEIDGRPASMSEAVAHATRLLVEARAPLIVGLTGSTNQTVAAAAQLADLVGAVVDPTSPGAAARNLAMARAGRISATLGEVRNRSDVVVFWGADPFQTHPRHWERYSVLPAGRFVPEGRAGRTVIVVDAERTATAGQADHFVAIDRSREFEIFWALRAVVKGLDLDAGRVLRSTGVELEDLRKLTGWFAGARYGALFHSPVLDDDGIAQGAAVLEAAQGLVRELNGKTRFVLLGLGAAGNTPGAEAALAWQTGFPIGVELAAGYPASLPGVTTARNRLRRGEADALVAVGPTDVMAESSARRIPTIAIGPPAATGSKSLQPSVRCHAANPGLEESGTVHRVDGVSLPLRPVRTSRFPTEREWLVAIRDKIVPLMKT